MLELAPAFSSCQDSGDGVSWNLVAAKGEKGHEPGFAFSGVEVRDEAPSGMSRLPAKEACDREGFWLACG